MPPRKKNVYQVTSQKLDTLQEMVNHDNEAINMIQVSLTTFELLLNANIELTRSSQEQIISINNQRNQNEAPPVPNDNPNISLLPISVYTDVVGRVHKQKILKKDILEAIRIVKSF